ncbi:hypothetical protein [Microbacterium maritypicum]|uniref:YobI family P-loop NTPase n=1 Tax=Microbacterium maritypicum TaxID=33918 RepID=UPI003A8FB279
MPEYDPARHGTYADALEAGIRGGKVSNVALAGSYGSGKSSILEEVVRRFPRQVVEVALTPLPLVSDENTASPKPAEDAIQKEIVKQLLYVLDPARARASKFPRASKDRFWRSALWATGVGVVGVAVQSLIAVAMVLVGDRELAFDVWLSVATFVAVTVAAFGSRWLLGGQWSIRDIKAGPTGLTLSKEVDVTYFDKYLDEIVYFFQVSKKRVVVFEDMDRFANTDIYVSLRALNQLLNNAAQLQPEAVFSALDRRHETRLARGGHPRGVAAGPIVFVYAVRDSLIPVPDVADDKKADTDRFARTKFFDLIVPVVPFVTPSNARDALTGEFSTLGSHQVHTELHQAVAQHFPDMRQLRNIRNEFQIYRERLLRPGKSLEQLDPNRLFALIAYKNADPADFDLIRLGASKLDAARAFAAQLTTQHLTTATARLQLPAEARRQEHADRFGRLLAQRCEVLEVSLTREDTRLVLGESQLRSLELLREVAEGSLRLESNFGSTTLGAPELEILTGESLDFARQGQSETSELELEQLRDEERDLSHVTWKWLYDTPRYTHATSEEDSRFAAYDGMSFAEYVVAVFGEGLVPALISRGMLTHDFALLITEYADQHISVTARSFASRVMERPIRTPGVQLSDSDIEQIIGEYTEDVLGRAGMVNVSVLVHLLVHRPRAARRVINQLVGMSEDDEAFLDEFFTAVLGSSLNRGWGEPAARDMVRSLARSTGAVLNYIARSPVLDSEDRIELFGHALGAARLSVLPASASGQAAGEYAEQHHREFTVLREDDPASGIAAAALVRLGVVIEDVAPLSDVAHRAVVELNGFSLTVPNLKVLTRTSPRGSLALDSLFRDDPSLYTAVTKRLEDYLALDRTEVPFAIETSYGLVDVLTNLADQLPQDDEVDDLLVEVAERSAQDVIVEDVAGMSPRVRDALFVARRAVPSIHNLTLDMNVNGEIPETACVLLASARRVDFGAEPPSDRLAFANQVVRLAIAYPDALTPDAVVEIVGSLDVEDTLDIAVMVEAPAALTAALTRSMHVNANELAGIVKTSTPWVLREALLEQTPGFVSRTGSTLVTAADVPAFLANDAISFETREQTLQHVNLFLGGDESAVAVAADALAAFALRHKLAISDENMIILASHTTEPSRIVKLMLLDENREAWNGIHSILLELDGPYRAIVDFDRASPRFPLDQAHHEFLTRLDERGYLHLLPAKPGDDFVSIKRQGEQ